MRAVLAGWDFGWYCNPTAVRDSGIISTMVNVVTSCWKYLLRLRNCALCVCLRMHYFMASST